MIREPRLPQELRSTSAQLTPGHVRISNRPAVRSREKQSRSPPLERRTRTSTGRPLSGMVVQRESTRFMLLQRLSLTAHRGTRLLFCRLDQFAHAFTVQFVAFEKPEYLVCGQREIFAHCEDYLPMGGLHRETHSHSMLPAQVDSPRNFVCSLCICAHGRDPSASVHFHPWIDLGLINVGL